VGGIGGGYWKRGRRDEGSECRLDTHADYDHLESIFRVSYTS
jgi:hypothetical protein